LALYAKIFQRGEKKTNIKKRGKGPQHHWASFRFAAKPVKREVLTTVELYVPKSKVSHTCSHLWGEFGVLGNRGLGSSQ